MRITGQMPLETEQYELTQSSFWLSIREFRMLWEQFCTGATGSTGICGVDICACTLSPASLRTTVGFLCKTTWGWLITPLIFFLLFLYAFPRQSCWCQIAAKKSTLEEPWDTMNSHNMVECSEKEELQVRAIFRHVYTFELEVIIQS